MRPGARPRTVTDFTRSRRHREAVHDLIPGGGHTYTKGDDQFPELAPAAIVRGKGGRVWDLDGNEYVDCSMGLTAVGLGHAWEPVLAAVREQLEAGANFQRPAALELEFARELLAAIPGADMVKFAKNGSSVTTAAVRLARAFTGRPRVAFPGNHAFYSYDDWFIGRTLANNGIPPVVRELSLTYDSTRPETLEKLFHAHPGEIACVITEPEELVPQGPEVLAEVARIARRGGAVFALDEMISGYRAGWPAAHTRVGLEADLVTWGKSIGNGFALCALTGRRDIMELGGIRQRPAPRVFLLSTTHGGETHTLAAARAVLREYQARDVLGAHGRTVAAVAMGMRGAVREHKLEGQIEVHSSSWRIYCAFQDAPGRASAELRTLFLQEMIGRGVLFQGLFVPCYAHTDDDVARLVRAFEDSCAVYRHALDHGFKDLLVGPATRPVFRRYIGCAGLCPSTPCPLEPGCRDGDG